MIKTQEKNWSLEGVKIKIKEIKQKISEFGNLIIFRGWIVEISDSRGFWIQKLF